MRMLLSGGNIILQRNGSSCFFKIPDGLLHDEIPKQLFDLIKSARQTAKAVLTSIEADQRISPQKVFISFDKFSLTFRLEKQNGKTILVPVSRN